MRVYRKTDYSRGVGVRKTAKSRKFSLPTFGQAGYSVNFRVGIALLAAVVVSLVGITSAHAAVNLTDPSDQAESYVLYRVLGSCVKQNKMADSSAAVVFTNDHIDVDNAKSGKWFDSSYGTGSYLYGVGGIAAGTDSDRFPGYVNCNQPALVNEAERLWGWKYDDMLCAIGYKRAEDGQGTTRCTEAEGGTSKFNSGDLSKYAAAVRAHVYGGKAPTLSNAAKYLLYARTFKQMCAPHAAVTTTKPAGNLSDREYAVKQVSGGGDNAVVKTVYYLGTDNQTKGSQVGIVTGGSFNASNDTAANESATCAGLVTNIGNTSDDYLAYAKANADAVASDDAEANSESEGTTCAIEGIGWIICPATRFFGEITDGFYVSIENLFLSTSPKLITTNDNGTGAYTAWQAILVIANIIFVIAFLFVIFSQATGYGISNYGVKKMLPKIIIGAILINLSFFLCQAAVDISNILGYGIHDLLKQINDAKPISWSSIINTVLTNAVGGAAVAGGAIAGLAALSTGLGVSGVLVAVLILAFIALFLIAQKVLIVVCVIVSPIAFAAWLLPNTEKFFKYWWKIFYAMLIVFPLASLVVGGSAIAASVIGGAIAGLGN